MDNVFLQIDEYLIDWSKSYDKELKLTIDELYNVEDMFDDIETTLNNTQKRRLDNFIRKYQEKGIIKGELSYKATKILNKKNVLKRDAIELMDEILLADMYYSMYEASEELFYNTCNLGYKRGCNDLKRPFRPFSMSIVYNILNIPLFNAFEYMYSLYMTNADTIAKQMITGVKVDKIDFNTLKNKFIKVTPPTSEDFISGNFDNKVSGGLEDFTTSLYNLSYLKASEKGNYKCKFVAVRDKKTTKMCKSLDGQVFYTNADNTYKRYSASEEGYKTYHTKGMVLGENLPPISDSFHYCRSTITYLLKDLNLKTPPTEADKEQYNRYKKKFGDRFMNLDDFIEMKKNKVLWERFKHEYRKSK